eukprot:gene15753-21876_t
MPEEGAAAAKPAAAKPVQAKAPKRKLSAEDKEKNAKQRRGPKIELKKVEDKKLKSKLRHSEKLFKDAQESAIKINEWLLPGEAGTLEAEGVERTYNFKQEDVVKHVASGAAKKAFDLALPDLGPYNIDFTRSGRYMLLGGRRGHLAIMDWQKAKMVTELQVAETTRDVAFLHNESFFAAAQKKYVYIYDKNGMEVHCMKEHTEINQLQFLPHHFMLATVGDAGILRYQDTSTGHIVAQHKTRLGPCSTMRQNPWNAVLNLGHTAGTVTMWTPNINKPVVKMLCHRGAVNALAVDPSGVHMVTAGVDGQVKVWDVRMLRQLHAYFSYSPATSLEISQRGLLAVGYGRRVQIWQDALRSKAKSPYMTHNILGGLIEGAKFCAGEANYDSFVANPFQVKSERREQEVHQLLDKLQPDSIVLDPESIGTVRKEPSQVQEQKRLESLEANEARNKTMAEENAKKTKMKGKNRPSKRHRKKVDNIVEEKKPALTKRLQDEERRRQVKIDREIKIRSDALADGSIPTALERFYKKV